jgi:hypothetical protein
MNSFETKGLLALLQENIDLMEQAKPEGWGWSKYMTPDGRVFLPKGDGFVMARIDTDQYGFAVRYVRGDDGGFRTDD